jgi:phosphoglycolate phosphatase-like HAD superfamily hydrolase
MPLDIPRIKALCFDVDGTLSDTDDQFKQKIERLLTPVKIFLPNRDPGPIARKLVMLSESPGNFLMGIPDKLGIDDELAAIGDFFYRMGHRKTDGFMLIQGIRNTLEKLQHHYPMSIVSARGATSTHIFLNQFNLHPFFDFIVTAHTCEYTKPYPDPIIWAARQMNVLPEECLMIGDTTVDIRAAKAAGAQSVGVLCGFGQEKELHLSGADLILDSTSSLAKALLTFP